MTIPGVIDPDEELQRLYADATIIDYLNVPGIRRMIWFVRQSSRRELTVWETHCFRHTRPPGYMILSYRTFSKSKGQIEDARRREEERGKWDALFSDDPDAYERNSRFEKLCYIRFWDIRRLTREQENFIKDEIIRYQQYDIRWFCCEFARWEEQKMEALAPDTDNAASDVA